MGDKKTFRLDDPFRWMHSNRDACSVCGETEECALGCIAAIQRMTSGGR